MSRTPLNAVKAASWITFCPPCMNPRRSQWSLLNTGLLFSTTRFYSGTSFSSATCGRDRGPEFRPIHAGFGDGVVSRKVGGIFTGQDIRYIMRTLRPIFEPLLRVATAAYDITPTKKTAITKAEERDIARKVSVVAFLKDIRDYQAPYFDDLDTSCSSSNSPRRQLIVWSPPAIPFLDLSALSPLHPDVLASLARRQPLSPSTPGRAILPQLHGLNTYPGEWASLPRSSGLEAELLLLDLSIERSASENGLLPPFQSPLPVLGDKPKNLFDGPVKSTELEDKSGEFLSSSPAVKLGSTAGNSKTGPIQGSTTGAAGVSNKASPLAVTSPRQCVVHG
ncbi:hypothetical protein C8R45DRAFT_1117001 [Mycena sanguinolenta]|nr:hypothetical protein C8R45DRAFT_1117001 [Mycena sanguinolenta]